MTFSSEASASIAGKIAIELATEALEDFLEDEENQEVIAKHISGSFINASKALCLPDQFEKNLDDFLGEEDEQQI
ncbi:hypothetical protein [Leptolyngbya iicbica]|uniref:Uncharacterized protein n=2 Tax=Cyanophyceae TaxID=3028117 RepID=A0A4Q7E4H3_9CYAN|nr:hypothetical protein [Leptolyngbya sp. LK]RZM76489.1 hypothetical protein DYY88_17605 [Leptolyngbya sp. LK]